LLTAISTDSISPPFQSQLEYLSQQQHPQSYGQYAQPSFDMSSLAGALPQSGRGYNQDPSSNMYGNMQYLPQRNNQFMDPNALARAQQQQQYMSAPYHPGTSPQRPQAYQMQQHVQYSPIDPYGYGMSPPQFSPMADPRYASQFTPMMPGMPGMPTDLCKVHNSICTAAKY
jgi:hypothetical protein